MVEINFSHQCLYQHNNIRHTKLKTIYVVSTYKRPVPLKHFLYTGNSKQTSDQLYEIVGTDGKFNIQGLVLSVHSINIGIHMN